MPAFPNKSLLSHEHFNQSKGEGQRGYNELSNHYANVTEYVKQRDLDCADVFWLFHDVTKSSKRQA